MQRKVVVEALRKLSRRHAEDIQDHVSVGSLGLGSSFGLSALRSVLERRTGVRLPSLTDQLRVGELVQLVTDGLCNSTSVDVGSSTEERTKSPLAPMDAQPNKGNFGVGVDLQEISALPLPEDYRTDSFYEAHFHPEEIATAMLRSDARAHLAGLFCAKEAAKKSHPMLVHLRMTDFRIGHTAAGSPQLQLREGVLPELRLSFAISITHTDSVAAAVCLTTWG